MKHLAFIPVLLCVLCCNSAAADTQSKPNIVFILGDDMGIGDFGCYNAGSKTPTPAVDRLAREGVRFTDAHSGSAVCSPTRYGILTGRYAWRTRLKRGVLVPYDPPLIEAGRLTVPSLLRQHGYATACIGKWHLGWQWPRPDTNKPPDFTQPIAEGPTTRGFDYYFGTDVPNYPPYCFIENDRTVGQPTAQKAEQNLDGRPGPMLPGWKFDEILPTLARRATDYIGQRAAAGKPFFLYFTLTSPHEPVAPSARFRGKSGISAIADFIMETDWAVGEVLAALDRHKLAGNTLVFFAADNGHSPYTDMQSLIKAGHKPSGPLRGYKGDIYEGGHRVPLVARWPGKTPAGRVCDETVCHGDLMATVAAILSAKLPDDVAEDSFNILPALLGEKRDAPLRLFTIHHSGNGIFAIREGPWKLIPPQTLAAPLRVARAAKAAKAKAAKPGVVNIPGQLYNLDDDLAETKNLYAEKPDLVKKMSALLKRAQEKGRSRP
ncbi:MAG: arylsulfatase [Verrucomicrobiia bacterium]